MTTPSRKARHPSTEGNFALRRNVSSSPPLEGWHVVPGWLESPRNRTYSPLSSRAKRGDPVNKKALRAFRPQTYCTGLPQSYANVSNVGVVLRNDSNICPAHMRGHYLHSKLYTLHSIIVTLCVTITSLCAQRVALWRGNEHHKKNRQLAIF